MLRSKTAQAGRSRCVPVSKPFTSSSAQLRRTPFVCPATDVKEAIVAAEVNDKQSDNVELSGQQVNTLLNMICQDTEIAEMHLQMGKFELKFKRNLSSKGAAPAAYTPAPAPAAPAAAPAKFDAMAPSMSMSLEDSVDESLMYITSPKVGIFRRGKYAGGKRIGKANCVDVGDQIKKGQVIGFVDQLGTHVAIESPQDGEISKFLVEDGAPVEYKQQVVEMYPYFGANTVDT